MNVEVELQAGKQITISTKDSDYENCSEELLWVDYKNIVNVVDVGKKVYIDDGLISVIVQEKGTVQGLSVF